MEYEWPVFKPGPLLLLSDLKAALRDPSALPPVDPELAQWKPSTEEMFAHPNLFARWRQMMAYDPETGNVWSRFLFANKAIRPLAVIQPILTQRRTRGNRLLADGRTFTAAKVVWLLHNGEFPKGHHMGRKDGNPFNDRIENLVELGSRHEGVRRYDDGWEAFAVVYGRHRRIGVAATEAEAIELRRKFDAGEINIKKGRALSGIGRYYDLGFQAYGKLPLGKRKHLGVHKTREEALAACARWEAEQAVGDLV